MTRKYGSRFVSMLVASLALLACGRTAQPPSASPAPKTVYLATLLSHPALDQIGITLRSEMASLGHVEGKDIRYIEKNANGDQKLVATIADEIAAQPADAVVAITTPMSQAVAKVCRAPFVFAAVTDPVGAGIVPSLDRPGPSRTGVSDAWPYRQQLELLREIAPSVRTIGVIFNPGDSASKYGIQRVREILSEMKLGMVEGSVSTPSEVATAAETLIGQCDALYLSSDATAISGFAGAMKVCFRAKKPLMAGDSGTVEKGALAAVSVGYAGVGRETARLLHRVLAGERDLPVVVAEGDEVYVNTKAAELSGVTIPEPVVKRARKIFTTVP